MNNQKLQRYLKEHAEPLSQISKILHDDDNLRERIPELFETTEARLGELSRLWMWCEANEWR